ncbi:Unannotated [Lentimonas sp. CC19]|nr:Unannotated [Lentimonas sp. CC10]CAA6694711.1 Unannotated [Lentimonas sp. CC19]CAA7071456.1 Unannotated [Lentimonas sp. CC11]
MSIVLMSNSNTGFFDSEGFIMQNSIHPIGGVTIQAINHNLLWSNTARSNANRPTKLSSEPAMRSIPAIVFIDFFLNVELWHPSQRALKFKWLSDVWEREWDCPAASGYGFERVP